MKTKGFLHKCFKQFLGKVTVAKKMKCKSNRWYKIFVLLTQTVSYKTDFLIAIIW